MNWWDINLIISLQNALSNPFFDYLFYIISFIGAEYFLLVFAVITYWCFSKRYAYQFLSVYLAGAVLTGVFKTIVARPRPYDMGAKSVISKTGGYSFPSGHSQNTANMATQISLFAYKKADKRRFIITVAAASLITALVMFSRLYLGQHYLTDVVAGAALGVSVAFTFTFLFQLLKNKEEWLFIAVLPLTVILAAVMIAVNKNPEGFIKLLGVVGAMSLGYFLEKKFVMYNVKSGGVKNQIIKVLLGGIILILIKEGLSVLFNIILPEGGRLLLIAGFLRYFLMGVFASYLAPMLFKKFKL